MDNNLFDTIRSELFTAVVGDVLDAAGFVHQFLPAQIHPLLPDSVMTGRAMPVLVSDCAGARIAHEGIERPFGLMMDALDDLKEGEVYLCAGATPEYALWGGLMSTRAAYLGAAGAVVDGYSRDTREITHKMNFPVFSHGSYAQDQGVRGRVVDYRCDIRFRNGAVVRPGDLIFGDVDGVVAIPYEHERDVVAAALRKVNGERQVRAAIEAGVSTREVYETYKIM